MYTQLVLRPMLLSTYNICEGLFSLYIAVQTDGSYLRDTIFVDRVTFVAPIPMPHAIPRRVREKAYWLLTDGYYGST